MIMVDVDELINTTHLGIIVIIQDDIEIESDCDALKKLLVPPS